MKNKETNLPVSQEGDVTEPFKGYTMEELKYQRALMALRKEFCKTKVLQSVDTLRHGGDRRKERSEGKSKYALLGRIATTLFSNLNTLDYVLMGMSLFGTAKKGYRLIRGKKR